MELNAAQREAVLHDLGPLLVIAGAGTGKTSVITQRIVHLIDSGRARPEEILALTFTDKAAAEMETRVDQAMPLGYGEIAISTFHGFCQNVLQEDALTLGLNRQFRVLNTAEQWLLLRENLFSLPLNLYRPLGNPTAMLGALTTHFSRLKDELVTPQQYIDFVQAEAKKQSITLPDPEKISEQGRIKLPNPETEILFKQWEVAQTYARYQALLMEGERETKLDFGDLIFHSCRLLRDFPATRDKYQQRYRYVLVDEFQDTNHAQNELVKLLVATHQNLMVVGDDDQSIYRFRGASVSNIMEFKADFPEAKTVALTENYRSTQAILDAAYQLIQHNNPDRLEVKINLSKRLTAQTSGGMAPEVIYVRTVVEEAEYVVQKILERKASSGLRWSDFAILARANNHLDAFVQELRYHNIPFQVISNRGLYAQSEILDLIAYLRVLINPSDDLHLFRVLSMPQLAIDPAVVLQLFQYARQENLTIFETMADPGMQEKLSPEVIEALIAIVSWLEQEHALLTTHHVGELLHHFVEKISLLKSLMEKPSLENENKILNINHFFDKIKQFLADSDHTTVTAFVAYLEAMIEAGENPSTAEVDESADGVNLLTVHSAKGLEFPHVFMVNLVSRRFPSDNRSDPIEVPDVFVHEQLPEGNAHTEEERRLFYVGMTRAKQGLYLCYAENYGGKRNSKPSLFIQEAVGSTGDQELVAPTVSKPLLVIPEVPVGKLPLPKNFSYSQIESFARCPLQYKFRYVYRMNTPPARSLVFGDVIHITLRDFYAAMGEGASPERKLLLEIYERNWRREGYKGADEMAVQKQRGEEALLQFFVDNEGKFAPAAYLEHSFSLPLGKFRLKGTIDRIDPLPDGSYEIIDYKTGKTPEEKDLIKRLKNDEQLSIYGLAAREVLKISVSKYSLYFLESGEWGQTTRSEDQLDSIRDQLITHIEQIHLSSFPAEPTAWNCRSCDYRTICPFAEA